MIISSNLTGIHWQPSIGKHLIGRGPQCDYVLDYDTVSRVHAELEILADGRTLLSDKGSRNGTFINEKRLPKQTELHPGDLIRFGSIEFHVADPGSQGLNSRDDSDGSALVTLSMGVLTSRVGKEAAFAPRAIAAISDLGKLLVIPASENVMLEKAASLLRDIIPFSRAAIFLVENGSKLNLVASLTDERLEKEFKISGTVMNEVWHRRNAVLIKDAASDPRYVNQDSIVAGKIKAAMAVPLLYEDNVIGVIYIDVTSPGVHYTEESARVVAIFANILAAKLANYDFLRQLREKEVLESEMAIASQIQRSLLPQNPPGIEGYHISAYQDQCRQVGGDLYDVAMLGDGRVIFIIADVSGKGTGAALLASNILASFRILYNTDNFDLLGAVGLVSDQLLAHSRAGDFATLFAGILDPATNTFQYVNAGHNSPIMVCRNGETRFLESSGIPIGLFGNQRWKLDSVEIEKGDFIFAFTDGITEAANSRGEQFGEERLVELLLKFAGSELSSLHARLDGESRAFLGDSPQSRDDATVIIIGREN